MPYDIRKVGDKWIKYKKGSNKIVSRHDSKEKAKASIRAYYANRNNKKTASVNAIYLVTELKKLADMRQRGYQSGKSYSGIKGQQLKDYWKKNSLPRMSFSGSTQSTANWSSRVLSTM